MDIAELETKVIEFIASKAETVDASSITTASRFEDLGFDSLDTVQLLFDAEEAFGVSFDEKKSEVFAAWVT